jgi:hypothetical protein
MATILEFPKTGNVPDYTGRLLTFNPEKATKFQCGGFIISNRRPSAVVTPDARMESIHRALQAGILVDITDEKQGIKTEHSHLGGVSESDTGKKVYFGTPELFRGLDLACLKDATEEDAVSGETICVMTEDPEEQRQIEERIAERKRRIVLAPGMDDPEKYLIKLDPQ